MGIWFWVGDFKVLIVGKRGIWIWGYLEVGIGDWKLILGKFGDMNWGRSRYWIL